MAPCWVAARRSSATAVTALMAAAMPSTVPAWPWPKEGAITRIIGWTSPYPQGERQWRKVVPGSANPVIWRVVHWSAMIVWLFSVYECGPWCGCDRARCQNRLVQRGIRVRLQVFQTEDRGWGVRCRDDLDHGTFVCIYAGEFWKISELDMQAFLEMVQMTKLFKSCSGLILQRNRSSAAPPSPKLSRRDVPSDDEVEVITEWLAPSDKQEAISSPHVPVIQRPTDAKTQQEKVRTLLLHISSCLE